MTQLQNYSEGVMLDFRYLGVDELTFETSPHANKIRLAW